MGGVGQFWMKYLVLDCLFVLLFLNLDSVTPCACEHAVCNKLLHRTSWFNVALRSYGCNVLEFRYRCGLNYFYKINTQGKVKKFTNSRNFV